MIHVRTLILAKEYESFSDTINAIPNEQSALSREIKGRKIVSYIYIGDSLFFELDNGKYLDIHIAKNSIGWNLLNEANFKKDELSVDCFDFEFEKQEMFKWNWKKVLDGLVGKQIAISPSEQFLFLFVRDDGEYIISAVENIDDTSQKFLYLSES